MYIRSLILKGAADFPPPNSGDETRQRERSGVHLTHLKHQPDQNKNHQAEDDIRMVLNEELLAEKRVTLVSSAECHVSSVFPAILEI